MEYFSIAIEDLHYCGMSSSSNQNDKKDVPQIQELHSLKVTCDGFGESYSCSVRIQRPNGDVFDRQSVIKQFGDWTIVWGPCLSE